MCIAMTVDAGPEAGPDASEAGVDAGPDVVEASVDAPDEAPAEAAVDAPEDVVTETGADAAPDAQPDAGHEAGPDASVADSGAPKPPADASSGFDATFSNDSGFSAGNGDQSNNQCSCRVVGGAGDLAPLGFAAVGALFALAFARRRRR
jgi:MYXO-CTERM domain-containing protein